MQSLALRRSTGYGGQSHGPVRRSLAVPIEALAELGRRRGQESGEIVIYPEQS